MMRLLNTRLAVSVTTAWMPPTSLDRRLWISPVRVSVKNRSGIRWRCAYSALRRSCITLLADHVVEVGLADADEAADDGQHDHQRRRSRLSWAKSWLRDRLVDEQLQQVRVDDAQERGEHDGRQHHASPRRGTAGRTPAMRRTRPRRAAPGDSACSSARIERPCRPLGPLPAIPRPPASSAARARHQPARRLGGRLAMACRSPRSLSVSSSRSAMRRKRVANSQARPYRPATTSSSAW